MPLRQHAASQAPRARTPGPPVAAWLPLGAALFAGLVVVAALAGSEPDAAGRVDVLPVLGGAIERTLHEPVVAGVLAGLLALLLAAVVRRARLRRLAWTATAVDVADFTAPEGVDEDTARQLTLRFRERLSELHLAAPGPQPGAAPASDFLQLIGSATQANGVLGFAGALLSSAWPQHAYQVQGALTRREGDKPWGVTIQVVVLPSTVSPPKVCWGSSYREAVDHAANYAAAFIMPRTRWVKRPPWADWKGVAMPPQLVDAYERGSVYTAQCRYDEALRQFYEALALDPKSVEIRLRIGFVQEKMGMPLDALATYQATRELADLRGGSEHTANIARYRLAVILGSGGELAHDWCRDDREGTARARERAALRAFMTPTLTDLCRKRIEQTRAGNREGLVLLLRGTDADEHRELRLREVFQVTALRELDELRAGLDLMPLADRQRGLTRTAVSLSKKCVGVRLDHTRVALADALGEPNGKLPRPTAAGLRAAAAAAGLRQRRTTWAERYCAASLYALGITCGAEQAEVDELAKAAVDELRQAVAAADTSYVASRRAWLVSEDPDLEDLRATHAFEQFEATCFPGGGPPVRRPREAHKWERVEYVRRLVRGCAERREALWQARADGPVDGHESHADWWDEEREAWSLIGRVALDCEHRGTRLELIDALRAWSERHGWARVSLDYPDFVDIAPAEPLTARDVAHAQRTLTSLERRAASEAARCPRATSRDVADEAALRQTCRERAYAWRRLQHRLRVTVRRAPLPETGAGNGQAPVPADGAASVAG